MAMTDLPESLPGAVITFPMLGESFSLNPSGTYTLFGHTLYWYGAIIGLGFLLGVIYCFRRGPREFGPTSDQLTDAVLIGLPATLVGARLYYVLCHWSRYVGATVGETLWNWCKIWEGGSAIPGGLALVWLFVWLYARKKKISFGAIMDTVAFGLMIGQIVGRWSNFMNREYLGRVTDVFCRIPDHLRCQIPKSLRGIFRKENLTVFQLYHYTIPECFRARIFPITDKSSQRSLHEIQVILHIFPKPF